MKGLLSASLIAVVASASALAQEVPPELANLARSDYGCEVLLCLANPGGPDEIAECRPPIERLHRDLARGRSFPTCKMASGPNGSSYATLTARAYDECPSGTTALPEGELAVLERPMTAVATAASGAPSSYVQGSTAFTYGGIGEGRSYDIAPAGERHSAPAKVCVSGLQGTTAYMDGGTHYRVSSYDTVFVQEAQSPSVIDVYIDDQLWQSVRY